MQVEYTVKPGWRHRVNVRLVVFLAAIALPFIAIFYLWASEWASGGIHHHGNVIEVDLKAMGNFPFDDQNGRITDVPRRFRELDGKRVELKGKMYAGFGTTRATAFQFVYDVNKCCFGGPPRVQERVFVHVPPGQKAVPIYGIYDLVDVVGTLHVRPEKSAEGTITSVYDMDLESLKPLM